MKNKYTVAKPEDVLTITGAIFNDNIRTIANAVIANAVNVNAQILKDALSRISELEGYIKHQQKIGYWTKHNLDPKNDITYLECSHCKSWYLRSHLTRNTYCPNCGSRNEKVR